MEGLQYRDMNNSEIRGVIFLIENEVGRFLLEQRDGNSKSSQWLWVFPGGARNNEEDTLNTVTREILEEFNIKINPDNCKKIGDAPTHSGNGKNEIWHCSVSGIKPPLVVGESAGAGWFTMEEIRKKELGYEQDKLVIPVLKQYFEI